MAQPSEIEQLEARRVQLLDESAGLRDRLAAEAGELQATTSWVETSYSVFQSVRPYWPLLAGGIGFFMTRRRGGWLRAAGKLWSAWKIAKRLLPFLQEFFTRPSASEQER